MEALKGSGVNVPDAVFAWRLDGKGGVKPLEDDDIITEQTPCWVHLNYTNQESAQWLASTPLLPNSARDALSGEVRVHALTGWVRGRSLRCAALTAALMNDPTSSWPCGYTWIRG